VQHLVKEGDLVAGKYRIDKVLGEGGMGVVVAAHHLQLDQKVAIKLLLPSLLKVPEAVQRFTREARAAVRIKNEHVARVFDVGTLDDGAPYMVMEYLEGGDLATWIERHGALPVEMAVDFMLQACEALADAHALGIVHRDLKPANLFCTPVSDGTMCIKVLDFGISRVAGLGLTSSDLGLTGAATTMGSPRYMSPEQMQSARDVDSRTDIWALGAILYELIAGRVPFPGESLPEICLKIATSAPAALRALQPAVPAKLEAVVMRCLEKERERRYPDVAALAAALAPFGSERGRTSAGRIAQVARHRGASTTAAITPAADSMSSPGRRKARRVMITIVVCAAAAGAAVVLWPDRKGPDAAANRIGTAPAPAAPAAEVAVPPTAVAAPPTPVPAAPTVVDPPTAAAAGSPAAPRPVTAAPRAGGPGRRAGGGRRVTPAPSRPATSRAVTANPPPVPPAAPPALPRSLIDERR
jgi:serine/threonine-protein kinase